MFPRYCIQREIGSMSPAQFKEKMLHSYYSNPANITGETLMNVLVEHRNYSVNPPVIHSSIARTLTASNVLAADLEGAENRYLVSGRSDSGIAIHDLHASVQQTIGPITRDVFPTALYIKPGPTPCNKPVDKVEWYPGDYGHFSSSSSLDNTVNIWDPNKGQITEKFKFDVGLVRDHCSSPHQPLIAVAHGGEIRLIDLRTGYTGQKFERPRAGLDMVNRCCRQPARPLTSLSSADPSSSRKRSKAPNFTHKSKKLHLHSSLPQGSALNSSLNSSTSRVSVDSSPASGHSSRLRNSSSSHFGSSSRDNQNTVSNQARRNGSNCLKAMEIQRRQTWLSETSRESNAVDLSNMVSCVRFHPSIPSALTAGYSDGAVVMWDVRASRSYLFNLMDHFREDESRSKILLSRRGPDLRYSTEGRYLISFDRDRVLLWDGYSGESLAHQAPFDIGTLSGVPVPSSIGDVQISTASKCVFVCVGPDVATFDLPTGTVVSQFGGHFRPIRGIVIDHGQHRLFTHGRDASFLTWSFRKKEPISSAKRSRASDQDTAAQVTKRERGGDEDDWSSDEDD